MDALGEGRLRDSQPRGGGGQRADLDDFQEVLELPDVRAGQPRSSRVLTESSKPGLIENNLLEHA
jgi:hypothetical protein